MPFGFRNVSFAGGQFPRFSAGTTLGDYALWKVLDNPNPYSTSFNDYFGVETALGPTHFAVGALGEDDASGTDSGKVYVYSIETGNLVYTLNNPNPFGTSTGDQFGAKLAINSTHLAVAASQEDDGSGTSTGRVYIYSLATGSLVQTLTNPNPDTTSVSDEFGSAIGMNNTFLAVGAQREDEPSVTDSGKVYIYNTSDWSLARTINNPNAYGTAVSDLFGGVVKVSDTYLMTGAFQEDDASGLSSGKVYIHNLSTGALVYTFNNPNPAGTSASDNFGRKISLTDNYAIVGAPFEDIGGFGSSGAAYVYSLSTGSLLYTLTNPDTTSTSANDIFGWDVFITNNYMFVGAYGTDNGFGQAGRVHVYSTLTGSLLYSLNAPLVYGSAANAQFGSSIAHNDTMSIITAPQYSDAGGSGSGKVFLYSRDTSKQIATPSNTGISLLASTTSLLTTITIPSTVQAGDLMVLFDSCASVTTDVTPTNWTSINKQVSSTVIRTNLSYKIAASGDAGTTISGLGGTARKILLVFRNFATNSITATPTVTGSQVTTAIPTNQTISGGTKPCIYFAAYASTTGTTTRGWSGTPTGVIESEYSSASSHNIHAKFLIYDVGTNENSLVNATISMSDGGTNTLQTFRMNIS